MWRRVMRFFHNLPGHRQQSRPYFREFANCEVIQIRAARVNRSKFIYGEEKWHLIP